MINVLYKVDDIVLAEYTNKNYKDYSLFLVSANPILLSTHETLSEGIREFYKYTRRLN